jgi:hypothetical protein
VHQDGTTPIQKVIHRGKMDAKKTYAKVRIVA